MERKGKKRENILSQWVPHFKIEGAKNVFGATNVKSIMRRLRKRVSNIRYDQGLHEAHPKVLIDISILTLVNSSHMTKYLRIEH